MLDKTGHILRVFPLLILAAAPVAADVVELVGKPPFNDVRVCGLRDAVLSFEGVSRETLRKPLAVVARIELAEQPAFTAAERAAAAGRVDEALGRYRSAMAAGGPPWLGNLIRYRIVQLSPAGAPLEDCVPAFLELVEADPGSTSCGALLTPAAPGSPQNRAARAALERALEDHDRDALTTILRSLLTELLICDDATELPDLPGARTGRPAVPGDATVTADGDAIIDLSPRSKSGPRPASVSIPSGSIVYRAVAAALDASNADRAENLLRRVETYTRAEERRAWELLKARVRLLRGDQQAAADVLARLSQVAPADAIAIEALYHLARALDAGAQRDRARTILHVLVTRMDTPPSLRTRAQELLTQMEPQETAP